MHRHNNSYCKCKIDPFLSRFMPPKNTKERLPGVFRGYQMGTLFRNRLIEDCLSFVISLITICRIAEKISCHLSHLN